MSEPEVKESSVDMAYASEVDQKIAAEIFEKISASLVGTPLTKTSLVVKLVHIMRLVGAYNNLSGVTKKSLVLKSVRTVIVESSMENEDKKTLLYEVNTTLPVLIDTYVMVGKANSAQFGKTTTAQPSSGCCVVL